VRPRPPHGASDAGRVARNTIFATTHWSVVLQAGHSESTQSRNALAKLCQTYWYPLYTYVRRRGCSPHDAQDLTQAFFARMLERRSLIQADPLRGRFRSFILAAMKNFLANEWEKVRAQKRGGGLEALSLDLAAAEHRYDLEPAVNSTAETAFDKQWALALLDEVVKRLEQEYERDGRGALFAELKQTLAGDRESQPYAVLAGRLGMNEGAVKTAVHRLRKRYRAILRAEIADSVSSPEEVDAELRHLFRAIATG
jgi:DNA-directed RNA polymerase specialized sigma24 family protein